jgi:hypothetical protein
MAVSNLERVGRGLELTRTAIAPFIQRELKSKYKTRWWQDGVQPALTGAIGKDAQSSTMSDDERFTKLDAQALIAVMQSNWKQVFDQQLGNTARNYVNEIRDVRNNWAHQQPFSADDAHRALDTMTRLCEMLGAPEQEELRKEARDLLRQRFEQETKREIKKSADVTQTQTAAGFKAWREIATPHPDVASGKYQQAEFAADLFQVITNKAEPEYGDPREFFRRTYFTEGLSRLLERAWLRLAGKGGDPVVELQTNFGGGKTHSMLALYHLFGGTVKLQDVPGIENLVPQDLGAQPKLPQSKRAVLVGTMLSPAEVRKKADSTQIHTLWGELAWQLGGKDGYKLVADEDARGISPGSEKLAELMTRYGPALILIDEWVAFARQVYGKDGLPAGSFDSNITFVQSLTEAAKAAKNALVVAAIPESDIEVGGEGGRAALDRVKNVFSRVEAVWKPASANESFEIVRRRLFQPITDHVGRDAVCRAFSEMYQNNRAEFPNECREAAYEQRMRSAYPIHPELFDRLYEDWSTLERFQRTRGVLRMMAAIIHELWERDDKSLLIMPGTLPLDSTAVRFEATRYLPEGWSAIIDRDVDGMTSRPLALDRDNPNLGRYSACRRVARTIFMGSAPLTSVQRGRGVERVRLMVGCVQPGETPAVFGDALRRLTEELTYLYSDASRYWYDTQPTLTRIASDRASQFKADAVEDEIIRRVRDAVKKERGDFAGVHVIPPSSADVPDDPECRLVILGPRTPHRLKNGTTKAHAAAAEMLDQRGGGPRHFRNMLVFLAPDAERLNDLEQAVRAWLAWTSILEEREQLNLDETGKRQATNQIKKNDETIDARLGETYSLLLVSIQDGNNPVEWTTARLSGNENLVLRASKKLKRDGQLITEWSPSNLRLELDKWLWRNQLHLGVKQLWDYLATYLYLPRLRDDKVLVEALRQGVGSTTWQENFAYADRVDENGRYIGLVAAQLPHVFMNSDSVIVKPEIAQAQFAADKAEEEKRAGEMKYAAKELYTTDSPAAHDDPTRLQSLEQAAQNTPRPPTRFQGSVVLDPKRVSSQSDKIAAEVIQHLISLMGANVTVTLEIQANVPSGVPENVVRTVTENCRTLKFTQQGFETE